MENVCPRRKKNSMFFSFSLLYFCMCTIYRYIFHWVGGRRSVDDRSHANVRSKERRVQLQSSQWLLVRIIHILVPYERARLQKFQQGRGIMRDSRSHLIPYSQCAVCIFAHANVNRCVLLDGLIPNFDFDGD